MRPRAQRSPWEGAREEELAEPLLPRWFVLLALATVPVAIGVGIWALVGFGGGEVAVAERRPPPDGPLTTAVGAYNVGDLPARPVEVSCAFLQGIQAGGTQADRERIGDAVQSLCEVTVPGDAARRLQAFAQADGVVRFAQFAATGVDSTLDTSADPPVVLVNARLARAGTDPRWIAPLLVHDVTWLEREPGLAEAAVEAREMEAAICERLFTDTRPSRACDDAAAVLALPDPLAALTDAGFR